jgi:hypothetical protein
MIAESSLPYRAIEGKQIAKSAKVTAVVPCVENRGKNGEIRE